MSYENIVITCTWHETPDPKSPVCGFQFDWTPRDQEFYERRGFSRPKYCRDHRELRKQRQQASSKGARPVAAQGRQEQSKQFAIPGSEDLDGI